MDTIQTRADLRCGQDKELRCRRAVAGLAIFSNAVLSGIALYQLGLVRDLPFAGAETVNGSIEAYSKGVPDALLGMASYAVTAVLAGYGPADRAQKQPWVPIALAAKVALDAAMAARMSKKSWRNFGRFSLPSMLVAGATALTLPFSIPEARRAITFLTNR